MRLLENRGFVMGMAVWGGRDLVLFDFQGREQEVWVGLRMFACLVFYSCGLVYYKYK